MPFFTEDTQPATGVRAGVRGEESRRLHEHDDVDTSRNAHHHTLGTGPNQAASGATLKKTSSDLASYILSTNSRLTADEGLLNGIDSDLTLAENKITALQNKIFDQTGGGSANYTGGAAIAAGGVGTPITQAITAPVTGVLLLNFSGGLKSTANCAASINLLVGGVFARGIRLHNNGDATRTPHASGLKTLSVVSGTTYNIQVQLSVDAGSSAPGTCTPYNLNWDFLEYS